MRSPRQSSAGDGRAKRPKDEKINDVA